MNLPTHIRLRNYVISLEVRYVNIQLLLGAGPVLSDRQVMHMIIFPVKNEPCGQNDQVVKTDPLSGQQLPPLFFQPPTTQPIRIQEDGKNSSLYHHYR